MLEKEILPMINRSCKIIEISKSNAQRYTVVIRRIQKLIEYLNFYTTNLMIFNVITSSFKPLTTLILLQ